MTALRPEKRRWSRVWFWPIPPDVEVKPEEIGKWLREHPEDRDRQ